MILQYGHYPSGRYRLEYTLVLPQEQRPDYPLLIQFHGSGWNIGSRNNHMCVAESMARAGVAVLLPFYRTFSSHGASPFDAVKDAENLYRYVLEHPEIFRCRPDAIALGGGSSGAQLALMAAKRCGVQPVCYLFENPAFDDCILRERCGETADWQSISPICQLESAMAPMLVSHAEDDQTVPVSYIRAFREKATALGNRCELQVYSGGGHGFYMINQEMEYAARHYRVMAANLEFFLQALSEEEL